MSPEDWRSLQESDEHEDMAYEEPANCGRCEATIAEGEGHIFRDETEICKGCTQDEIDALERENASLLTILSHIQYAPVHAGDWTDDNVRRFVSEQIEEHNARVSRS